MRRRQKERETFKKTIFSLRTGTSAVLAILIHVRVVAQSTKKRDSLARIVAEVIGAVSQQVFHQFQRFEQHSPVGCVRVEYAPVQRFQDLFQGALCKEHE